MNYDIVTELEYKRADITQFGKNALRKIFEGIKIDNLNKNIKGDYFNICSNDGIKSKISFEEEFFDCREVQLETVIYSNSKNINMYMDLYFVEEKLYRNIECDSNIMIKNNDGYYFLCSEYSKKSRICELNLYYYDNESINYYKKRNKIEEVVNVSISELENCGLLPDDRETVKLNDVSDIFTIYNMAIKDKENFFDNMLDYIKNEKKELLVKKRRYR